MTNNPIRTMRSDMIKKGFERAPHRSLLRATGVIQRGRLEQAVHRHLQLATSTSSPATST